MDSEDERRFRGRRVSVSFPGLMSARQRHVRTWGCRSNARNGRNGRGVFLWGFHRRGIPNSWLVYNLENPIKMDDSQIAGWLDET